MAAPVFQNFTARQNVSSTTYTGDAPLSIASGDLLIAQIGIRATTANTFSTVPTGWNLMPTGGHLDAGAPNAAGSVQSHCYYKTATGSEPTSYAWVGSVASTSTVGISRYTGQDGTTPINVSAGQYQVTGSTTYTHPNVTTTVANTLVVYMSAINGLGGTYSAWGFGAEEYQNTTGGGSGRAIGAASGAQAATGTTSGLTVTNTSSTTPPMHTVAIAPAAAAAAADVYYQPPGYMVDFY